MAEETSKHRHMLDSQYVCIPKFQNKLPTAPSGPFFQKVALPRPVKEYATYRPSSLEKSYTWQPHVGYDIGMDLNLVDRESVLVSKEDRFASVSKLDKAWQSSVGTAGGRDNEVAPTWLRTTTYTEDQIYVPKKSEGGAGLRWTGEDEVKDHDEDGETTLLKRKRAEQDTFEECDRTVAKLKKAAKSPRSVESVSELLPEESQWTYMSTLVKFFEDPYAESKLAAHKGGGLLKNFEEVDAKTQTFSASLVAPTGELGGGGGAAYGHVLDVHLPLTASNVQGTYAVSVNMAGPSTYYPVRMQVPPPL